MSNDEKTKVSDKSNDRKYFIVTPRLVWALCEDPYEYTFWSIVKDIAGEDGECILSRDDMATLSMMSGGKASKCRDTLIEKKLLQGEFKKDPDYPQPVWHLSIPDFWEANIRWARMYPRLRDRVAFKRQQLLNRKPSPGDGVSPGDGGMPPGDGGMSLRDLKKTLLKNHKEEEINTAWEKVIEQLKGEMTRSSFEIYLQDTFVIRFDGNALMVVTLNSETLVWLESRVQKSAERALVGILAREVAVRFVVAEAVPA